MLRLWLLPVAAAVGCRRWRRWSEGGGGEVVGRTGEGPPEMAGRRGTATALDSPLRQSPSALALATRRISGGSAEAA